MMCRCAKKKEDITYRPRSVMWELIPFEMLKLCFESATDMTQLSQHATQLAG